MHLNTGMNTGIMSLETQSVKTGHRRNDTTRQLELGQPFAWNGAGGSGICRERMLRASLASTVPLLLLVLLHTSRVSSWPQSFVTSDRRTILMKRNGRATSRDILLLSMLNVSSSPTHARHQALCIDAVVLVLIRPYFDEK